MIILALNTSEPGIKITYPLDQSMEDVRSLEMVLVCNETAPHNDSLLFNGDDSKPDRLTFTSSSYYGRHSIGLYVNSTFLGCPVKASPPKFLDIFDTADLAI